MEKQTIQAFTRRLSQCNQGEMIVIIYDIFFEYAQETRKAFDQNDREGFKEGIRNLQRTLDELIHSLNMSYEIAGQLYSLYMYCKRLTAMAQYENKLLKIEEAENIMRKLYSSFVQAAALDKSEPLMSNTQQVYAGITYGKNQLNESFVNNDYRGFFV